jgi:hypothetical protein
MTPFGDARKPCNSTREREQGKYAHKCDQEDIDMKDKTGGVHGGRRGCC